MLTTLQLSTLFLVSIAMACAVGHALELPGKMRLPRDVYFAAQTIYYPGFTYIGGIGEVAGLFAMLALVIVTPRETVAFWLTLSALGALLIMVAIFWLFTQPINKVWVRDLQLEGASAAFFRARSNMESLKDRDWTSLRNQWEYSHVARAVMAAAALMLLAAAVAMS